MEALNQYTNHHVSHVPVTRVQGKMALPRVDEQEADVVALKQYKRSWMPASKKRASTVALHDIYYHDQLVEDMGFNSHTYVRSLNVFMGGTKSPVESGCRTLGLNFHAYVGPRCFTPSQSCYK